MRLFLILLTDNAGCVTLPRATQTKLTELQNNYHLLNSLLGREIGQRSRCCS